MPCVVTKSDPVIVYHKGGFAIATFGGNHRPLQSSVEFANEHHSEIKFRVEPPSTFDQPGFRNIETKPCKHIIVADGIMVSSGMAVAIASRDCPIVILMDTTRNVAVVCHAGRAAMTPVQHLANRNHTIVTQALGELTSTGSRIEDIYVYITAGICGQCFIHDLKKDRALLQSFKDQYNWAIDEKTGGLDLIGIIISQLEKRGVRRKSIQHDGLCTKENLHLTSKRGGDSNSNLVVVLANKT